jgi:D-alanyl-D-alanine carboxypeptidase (penicillin-binding protein 5/6)
LWRSALLLVLCLLLCASFPAFAAGAPASVKKKTGTRSGGTGKAPLSPHYDVKAAITLDMTRKKVLHEQNADRIIAPASLTKVLTMFVVMDHVKSRKVSLRDLVAISDRAAATGGSRMGVQKGEKIPLRDLLTGMAVASGNDAAVAAAQHVAGTEAAFVRLMNRKARQLGMRNSVFENVHGLPAKRQSTTARDMLTMTTQYLAAHPEVLVLFHRQRYLAYRGYTPNTNPLLGMEGVDGLKTGYVGASGYNLITTAQRGNTRLVNVLLGADSKSVRLREATKMVETGFVNAKLLAEKEQQAKDAAAKKKAASAAREKTRAKAAADKGGSQADAPKAAPSGGAKAATEARKQNPGTHTAATAAASDS